MTTPKKFTASDQDSRDAEQIDFELGGVYAPGRTAPDGHPEWAETFTVTRRLDASMAGWYAQAFTILEGKQVVNPPAVIQFIRLACTPESALRYQALIDDPDRLVDVNRLGDVFVWLSDEVIDRPTQPPSAS